MGFGDGCPRRPGSQGHVRAPGAAAAEPPAPARAAYKVGGLAAAAAALSESRSSAARSAASAPSASLPARTMRRRQLPLVLLALVLCQAPRGPAAPLPPGAGTVLDKMYPRGNHWAVGECPARGRTAAAGAPAPRLWGWVCPDLSSPALPKLQPPAPPPAAAPGRRRSPSGLRAGRGPCPAPFPLPAGSRASAQPSAPSAPGSRLLRGARSRPRLARFCPRTTWGAGSPSVSRGPGGTPAAVRLRAGPEHGHRCGSASRGPRLLGGRGRNAAAGLWVSPVPSVRSPRPSLLPPPRLPALAPRSDPGLSVPETPLASASLDRRPGPVPELLPPSRCPLVPASGSGPGGALSGPGRQRRGPGATVGTATSGVGRRGAHPQLSRNWPEGSDPPASRWPSVTPGGSPPRQPQRPAFSGTSPYGQLRLPGKLVHPEEI